MITLVNPLYLRLINNRDVIGKPVRTALPEAAGQGYIEILDRVFKGEPYVGVGSRYDAFAGEGLPPDERYVDFTYQPLREADGTVSGIIVLGVDVTARRKSEAALRQSEKLAAAGRLAASIAHEINNPLEAVTNLLYLLNGDRGLSAEGRELLAKAEEELARVSHTANQTLRFYRQTTHPTKVAMGEVLDSVIALHNLRRRNSADIFIRQYQTVPMLLAFESELRQVFSNLLGNAADALLPDGRIVLRIRESTDWRFGRKGVRVVVADDGHGMDRETMKRLFEPFFSTKGTIGTGLGLWVSREIVEKHGGFVRFRSCKTPARHGTVFSVFLPFQETAAGSRDAPFVS